MRVQRYDLSITSSLYSREASIPRSEGCHLMQVVERIIAREEKRKSYGDYDEAKLERLRAVGFVWERVMGEHARVMYPDQDVIEIGEQFWCYQCDTTMPGHDVAATHCSTRGHRGIYFTTDRLIVPEIRVLDHKFTWMSSKRTGEDHLDGIQKWIYQLGWYCMGNDTEKGRIEAMFCHGDYSPGPPDVHAYRFDIEYSKRDLDRNKTMIVSNAVAEGLL